MYEGWMKGTEIIISNIVNAGSYKITEFILFYTISYSTHCLHSCTCTKMYVAKAQTRL